MKSLILLAAATAVSSLVRCPPHWKEYGDSCYIFAESWATRDENRQKCKEMGGSLVVPQSHEENDFIRFNLTQESEAWLGLHRIHGHKLIGNDMIDTGDIGYVTMDKNETLKFTNWMNHTLGESSFLGALWPRTNEEVSREPDCSAKDCCVVIKGDGSWEDRDCWLDAIDGSTPGGLCKRLADSFKKKENEDSNLDVLDGVQFNTDQITHVWSEVEQKFKKTGDNTNFARELAKQLKELRVRVQSLDHSLAELDKRCSDHGWLVPGLLFAFFMLIVTVMSTMSIFLKVQKLTNFSHVNRTLINYASLKAKEEAETLMTEPERMA